MKNSGLYFVLLALSAVLAILIACGQGDIVDLSDRNSEEFRQIEEVLADLADQNSGFIDYCAREENKEKQECKVIFPSSSSVEEKSSSSSEKDDKDKDESSSSRKEEQSSPSSSAAPSSSSSGGSGGGSSPSSASGGNNNYTEVPAFTCSWNPSEIANGGKTQVNIKFNDGAERNDCTKKAWFRLTDAYPADTVFFELGKDITASGKLTGKNNSSNTADWPKDGALFRIKSTVICGAHTKDGDCAPLTIGSAPKPSSSSYVYIPPSSNSGGGTSSNSGGSTTCNKSGGNMCLWNGAGACWPVSGADVDNCARDGWLFAGGSEGATTMCSGGTFTGCGKNTSPPTTAKTSIGCCDWDKKGKCWDVFEQSEVDNCNNTDHRFWSRACPNTDGGCP